MMAFAIMPCYAVWFNYLLRRNERVRSQVTTVAFNNLSMLSAYHTERLDEGKREEAREGGDDIVLLFTGTPSLLEFWWPNSIIAFAHQHESGFSHVLFPGM